MPPHDHRIRRLVSMPEVSLRLEALRRIVPTTRQALRSPIGRGTIGRAWHRRNSAPRSGVAREASGEAPQATANDHGKRAFQRASRDVEQMLVGVMPDHQFAPPTCRGCPHSDAAERLGPPPMNTGAPPARRSRAQRLPAPTAGVAWLPGPARESTPSRAARPCDWPPTQKGNRAGGERHSAGLPEWAAPHLAIARSTVRLQISKTASAMSSSAPAGQLSSVWAGALFWRGCKVTAYVRRHSSARLQGLLTNDSFAPTSGGAKPRITWGL